jgi:hypothetical protein
MSKGGLERKADPEAYVEKVEQLAERARSAESVPRDETHQ